MERAKPQKTLILADILKAGFLDKAQSSANQRRQRCSLNNSIERAITSALRTTFILLVIGIILPSSLEGAATRDDEGFRWAEPGYKFQFPKDHGSHPEFKIEWWYLTGHLWNADRSRRFGYQATFFRRGIRPISRETTIKDKPTFGSSQVYLAHMTILDVNSQSFVYEERVNRDGWDASAALQSLEVRNGNWSLMMDSETEETMTLNGSVRAEAQFRLHLRPSKPKVSFGDDGVSRKGAGPAAASHYITFTRLKTNGSVTFQGETLQVEGQTWMDHEISSSQLDTDQVGWDWASIQLDQGEEIMIYVMRKEDNSIDPFSTLAWIDAQGKVTHSGPETFTWKKTKYWKSEYSQASYPIQSTLHFTHPIKGTPMRLQLKPLTSDQEVRGELGGITYWEGACDVIDGDSKTVGTAYVELAGYDGKLQKTLR